MFRTAVRAAMLLGLTATTACYHPPPPTPAQVALQSECREDADRQYVAQNRADLTRRDERDFAFSAGYEAGVQSRGLGAEYAREQSIDTCLRRGAAPASQDAAPGIGPTFSPATRVPGPPSP